MNDLGLWFFASIPVLLVCFILLQVLERGWQRDNSL